MSAQDFFRKYLDILSEATGSQQDIEKMMGNLGVSPEELAARQAQDAAANPQPVQTKAGVTNPNVDPNITKQIAANQNTQAQTQQANADLQATAQARGAEVQAMQKAGIDKKTVDMYASGDLQGLANQAAGAVKTLPSKAQMQKMGKDAMASKEFASLPKAQQDELRATYAQLDQIPDDYREQGAQNFKQVGGINAQDQSDKLAGRGLYNTAQIQPRVEKKYTEKEVTDLMNNNMNPNYQTKADIVKTITKPATPATPVAPQPTAPAAPAQQTAPAAQQPTAPTPQPTQPQQTTEEELDEELQKILRLSGRQKQTTNENDSFKKFYSVLNESTDNDEVDLHDSFDIELNEHFVIETGIVGFTKDGIIIEADETVLDLLELNSIICEDETMDQREEEVAEAEYQGRKVPLGKPMAGDVAKSKVYVKKPNGKVVKVNFGDKNMKIKKSNPKRRKSFRARHRCENPGPRWKARYWSCRAW
jgi:hypothetical protein